MIVPKKTSAKEKEGGFTLLEVLVASSISMMSLGLVYTALIGMAITTRTTMEQVNTRTTNERTLKKLGRRIMEATKVDIPVNEQGLGKVHVWRDEQAVWTPDTTDDDIEGIIYYDDVTREIRFLKDVNDPAAQEETLATDVEAVSFNMVGQALFADLTMEYDTNHMHDPTNPDTKRHLYASFAVRNNPRLRIGSAQ